MTASQPMAVVLSPLRWEGLWTSRHELASVLARRGWKVLFFDPPANLLRPGEPGWRRPGGRRRSGAEAPRRPVPQGVAVLRTPRRLPYGWARRAPVLSRALIALNATRFARHVAAEVRRRRPEAGVDLLLNSFMPVLGHRVDRLVAARAVIYHRADELRQFPDWSPVYSELEEEVARRADAVVAVSEPVRAGISSVRPDAEVVPNGVDPSRFRDARPDPELAGLDHPVTVMVGVFDRRVDPVLLEAVASVSRLVMVGRRDGIAVPEGAVWLGEVEPTRVPALLAAADVGVVCYRTYWAGDLLKTYEYLAAGLPVVSSDLPGLGGLRGEVTVAGGPEAFAAAVVRQAAARGPEGDHHRREVAEANSWDERVDRMLALVGLAPAGAEAVAGR